MSHIGTGSGRSVADQSGTPRLLQKITIDTTPTRTPLNTTTLDDYAFERGANQQILIQTTVDCRFELRKAGSGAHVTLVSGDYPGVLVKADWPGWWTYLNRKDVAIDLVALAGTGVVCIYLIQT